MKNILLKYIFIVTLSCWSALCYAQEITRDFNNAYKKFASDNSFKHATLSLLVKDNSGQKIIDIGSETGLAPASCQKVIAASTAFELLGHDYTYKTILGYSGEIENGTLNGNIIIIGSGDPTLGSWRYNETKEDNVISEFKSKISQAGINEITGHVYVDETLWKGEVTPDGWIWQDIGSYYGAGARALNWRENQYDLFLQSGNHIGDSVDIVQTKPKFIEGLTLKSLATSAERGSGDNAYIYLPVRQKLWICKGNNSCK